jgi:regulator of protease activity HflC (stomatin/prohibitin superfamily)
MCDPLGCLMVSESEVKVVEQCGKYHYVAHPGCNCANPCMCQKANGTLSMRLEQLQVTCVTKTKDNVFITINVAVQYQINNDEESIKAANYRLQNATQQIRAYVLDVVRGAVPRIPLDDVFTQKEEVSSRIKSQLTEAMSGFGYRIIASPITDIDPDPQVKAAMNEINRQKRLKDAAADEGEAVKVRAIKQAEAEAARIEIQAKADAEAKFMAGQGISRQRSAIMNGLQDSVTAFKDGVSNVDSGSILDLMITTQYFDMMKEVGEHSRSNALYLQHSPAALQGLAAAVRQGCIAPGSGDMKR